MSKLWITELSELGHDSNANAAPIGQYPAVVNQSPITLGASALSAAFHPSTRYLRLRGDGICHYVIGLAGSTPVATTSSTPLDANSVEHIAVPPGGMLAACAG